jgi:hypothetical protein
MIPSAKGNRRSSFWGTYFLDPALRLPLAISDHGDPDLLANADRDARGPLFQMDEFV